MAKPPVKKITEVKSEAPSKTGEYHPLFSKLFPKAEVKSSELD